MQSYY